VTRIAWSVPGVLDVHDLKAEYIGSEMVRASMHIMVPGDMSVEEADRIAEEVQNRVQAVAGCDYCIVHLDAFSPEAVPRRRAAGE
jgi:divalent metal cation (Fe/Co/Zn/Cd) transporter